MEDKEEILKRVEEYKEKAKKCFERGEWVLASQYLLDANSLLPEKYRVKMPPPPKPEDYD